MASLLSLLSDTVKIKEYKSPEVKGLIRKGYLPRVKVDGVHVQTYRLLSTLFERYIVRGWMNLSRLYS